MENDASKSNFASGRLPSRASPREALPRMVWRLPRARGAAPRGRRHARRERFIKCELSGGRIARKDGRRPFTFSVYLGIRLGRKRGKRELKENEITSHIKTVMHCKASYRIMQFQNSCIYATSVIYLEHSTPNYGLDLICLRMCLEHLPSLHTRVLSFAITSQITLGEKIGRKRERNYKNIVEECRKNWQSLETL